MKHAYLILAHNEFGMLQTLVSCMDDPRNDIYVHIDKKVKSLPVLHTEKAGLEILSDRIDIRWGDFSMVEAEYALFETAATHGPYAYYHLLSGVDLPLKSQDTIHAFCDAHPGMEYIGYSVADTSDLERRMQRWHLFPRHFSRTRTLWSVIRSLCIRMQEILHIKRNRDVEFRKGSQWVSITQQMVQYALDQKDWVRRTFTHTFVPDECVMQTLCWMSPFRDKLYNVLLDGIGCMRTIGWRGSELKDWCAEDFDYLSAAPTFFARKFNSSDPAFIARVLTLSQR